MTKIYWPSWRYHKDCPEGKIFPDQESVPEGWVEHPSQINDAPTPEPKKRGRPAKKDADPKELEF